MDFKSKEYQEYRRAIMENVPYNTPEKAKKFGEIWEKFHNKNIWGIENKERNCQ